MTGAQDGARVERGGAGDDEVAAVLAVIASLEAERAALAALPVPRDRDAHARRWLASTRSLRPGWRSPGTDPFRSW